jgi:hypothetical protein
MEAEENKQMDGVNLLVLCTLWFFMLGLLLHAVRVLIRLPVFQGDDPSHRRLLGRFPEDS